MKTISAFISAFFFLTLLQAQEMHIKTSDSVELYVTVKGKGTPCLYVHGGPGSGSYWLEKFAGDSLEQHFQMIYLDQRGVGRSTSPWDQNYSMDRMVKDFEEVRIALGIKQWITLGHSFGGLLQMGYSQSYPEVMLGMIMINCSLNFEENYNLSWCPKACEFLNITDIEPYLDKSKPIVERWGSLIQQLNVKELMWKMGFSSPENMNIVNATYSELPSWNCDFGNVAMEIKDYWVNYKKLTSNMKMPVLFFYGEKDWMIGPEHFKGVNFPNMILYRSNVGHFPFLENKADLAKSIESYIEKYNFNVIK